MQLARSLARDRLSLSLVGSSQMLICWDLSSHTNFFFLGWVSIGSFQASSTIFNRSSGAISHKSLCNGTFPMLKNKFCLLVVIKLAFEVKIWGWVSTLAKAEGGKWERMLNIGFCGCGWWGKVRSRWRVNLSLSKCCDGVFKDVFFFRFLVERWKLGCQSLGYSNLQHDVWWVFYVFWWVGQSVHKLVLSMSFNVNYCGTQFL